VWNHHLVRSLVWALFLDTTPIVAWPLSCCRFVVHASVSSTAYTERSGTHLVPFLAPTSSALAKNLAHEMDSLSTISC